MGDAAAMMVDALTYLLNWYVERQKRAYAEMLQRDSHGDLARLRYRKYHLQLELLSPLVSTAALLAVTGLVLNKAIRILILDTNRDISLQSDPNLNLMLLFSILNLFLDVFNVFFFAKANHVLGFETGVHDSADDSVPVQDRLQLKSAQRLLDYDPTGARHADQSDMEDVSTPQRKAEPFEIENAEHNHKRGEEDSNLNMCSAYTHVFADTLRSMAVIIASILADFVPTITPEEADAAAAVVVSVLIAFSLVPLAKGMLQTVEELRQVNALLIEGLIDSLDEDEDFDDEDG